MKLLNHIVNDTLKSPNGKWSRKSLTMFVSFKMAILTGIYIVAIDHWMKKDLNPYAIQVFYGFLITSGGTSALTVWDKFKNGKKENCETGNSKEVIG